ncbi:MAG: ZPR1 zinc finger domain-containing protein [Candidatus Thorarchaeota archaeon]
MSENAEHTIACPSCEKGALIIRSELYSIPFFNELVMFSMKCPLCNFAHTDVFSAEERKPARFTLTVDDPALLRARVVRSGSGTFRLPEFGIDVQPGPAAESFITNVEGVLTRVRSVVETAVNFSENSEEKKQGAEILSNIDCALDGGFTFSLIMEDPMGVSGIILDDMSKINYEELSREEASTLKGAPYWIDSIREDFTERKG